MRVKKLMMVTALTASLVMSTMTVSAAPQDTQTQSEVEYTTKASESELAAIKKLFNAKEYAAMYPDVAVVYGDNEEALWSHFVNFGLAEGRALRKDFNVFAYRSAYKDLQDVFGTDLAAYYAHYASNGMEEGRPLTTIEKVTKAGIAVTGLQGQILAEPVPAVQTTTAVLLHQAVYRHLAAVRRLRRPKILNQDRSRQNRRNHLFRDRSRLTQDRSHLIQTHRSQTRLTRKNVHMKLNTNQTTQDINRFVRSAVRN